MTIILHEDLPATIGYYSKVTESRKIVTKDIGAQTFSLYEQTIPPGGYIVNHLHTYEESLTFIAGQVIVTINGKTTEVNADATIFIPPNTQHSIKNDSDQPARLIAVHAPSEPKVIYPDGHPVPVKW